MTACLSEEYYALKAAHEYRRNKFVETIMFGVLHPNKTVRDNSTIRPDGFKLTAEMAMKFVGKTNGGH